MVLEEATASPPADSFAEDSLPSDADPYDSESRPAPRTYLPYDPSKPLEYEVDISKLPQPWSLLGPRPLPKSGVDALRAQYSWATRMAGRQLSQPEIDAFAYHITRGIYISSLAFPVGAVLGTIRAAQTWNEFRFPYWTPLKEGGWFDRNQFGFLRGSSARNMWHGLRVSAYIGAGVFFTGILFSSYALSVDAAGKAMDPRLKDFNDSLREKMKQGRMNEPVASRGQRAPITTKDGQMDSQAEKAREVLRRGGGAPASAARNDDDMSPTAASWARDGSESPSDTGLLSDSQLQSREVQQQADERTSPTESRSSTFDMNKVTSQPPTPESAAPAGGKANPPVSSWERIRREAAAGKGQQRQGQSAGRSGQRDIQREQQQGSTLGDSFSFSQTDEERQLAQSEAQKDFDARLEKERRGEDFDEGDRGRKW